MLDNSKRREEEQQGEDWREEEMFLHCLASIGGGAMAEPGGSSVQSGR